MKKYSVVLFMAVAFCFAAATDAMAQKAGRTSSAKAYYGYPSEKPKFKKAKKQKVKKNQAKKSKPKGTRRRVSPF